MFLVRHGARAFTRRAKTHITPPRRNLFSGPDGFDPFSREALIAQGAIVFVGGIGAVAVGISMLHNALSKHPTFGIVMAALEYDDAVRDALGSDVQQAEGVGGMMLGQVISTPETSFVRGVKVSVAGTRGSGEVFFNGQADRMSDGELGPWRVTSLRLKVDQSSEQAEQGVLGDIQTAVLKLLDHSRSDAYFDLQAESSDSSFEVAIPCRARPTSSEGAFLTADIGELSMVPGVPQDQIPLWGKIAFTGTCGLIIGTLGAIVANRVMRASKPSVYRQVLARLNESPGIKKSMGYVNKEDYDIHGHYNAQQANFHFFIKSRDWNTRSIGATARVSVIADKADDWEPDGFNPKMGDGGWKFKKIEVDVDGVKRPIRLDKGH